MRGATDVKVTGLTQMAATPWGLVAESFSTCCFHS